MDLKPCRSCGKPVAHDAETCPKCGKPDPTGYHLDMKVRVAKMMAEEERKLAEIRAKEEEEGPKEWGCMIGFFLIWIWVCYRLTRGVLEANSP